ncbi:MAG: FMN-binding negative transcriptional regulator [Rubrivivax sp.]|nr:FMN-binding negative transcriptional regulator [Rubrivivax sp.]
MYLPPHFEQHDPAALHALMREHPLAALVSSGPGGLTADHVPLQFDPAAGEYGTLLGHVARANPLWRVAAGTPVLALFSGPQAYVSPSWYPSKAAAHKVVPTWNYAVVHAHGVLEAVDDAPWLRALVGRLTDHHEAPRPAPWSVDDAPADYIQQMLRAIVGIRIPVTRLVGKWKVSQNRSQADRLGVAAGLAAGADVGEPLAMANLVRHPLTPPTEEPS